MGGGSRGPGGLFAVKEGGREIEGKQEQPLAGAWEARPAPGTVDMVRGGGVALRLHPVSGLVLEAAGSLAFPVGGTGAGDGAAWDLLTWLHPHHTLTEAISLSHFGNARTKARSQGPPRLGT